MKHASWKETAELIGIAAIVASLVFVGFQMKQEQEIAVSQIYADWDDTRIEWARLINENDDLWARGLSGEQLEPQELLQFEVLADAWYHMEHGRFVRAQRISLADPDGVIRRDASFVKGYPGLHQWWDRRNEYRRSIGLRIPDFSSAVDQFIRECETGDQMCLKPVSFAPM